MKNTAITQNNSHLQYQWATEIFQQFDFGKYCGEREEGEKRGKQNYISQRIPLEGAQSPSAM